MADNTILCRKPEITVSKYREMEAKKEAGKPEIITFIRNRFTERYIAPLNAIPLGEKHGFCIMAICCLMIEALECFWEGLEETSNKKGKTGCNVFKTFFARHSNLSIPSQWVGRFYGNVRCVILHQAETTDGWKITRKGSLPLFDEKTRTINATKFHKELKQCLEQYCDALKNEDWNSLLWKNFIRKMGYVCKNC